MNYFCATKELKQRYKAVLSGAFFWGILSNGMGLFNKYSYHDDINNLFKHQGSAALGRWMLYCRYDNKCYLKASYVQAEAISYFTTLVTRIKSTEGYKDEYPVLYVNPGNISDLSLEKQEHFSEIRNDPYWDLDRYVNDFAWIRFMGVWCGYAPKYSIIETKDCMEQQILDMASYPDDGSIKVIDETVVVKFQDQASIE